MGKETICSICGIIFVPKDRHNNRSEKGYCGRKCQGIGASMRMTGKKRSPESIEKTRQKNLGKKRSDLTCSIISEALRRHVRTEDHSRKISEALMGIERKPIEERFWSKVEKLQDGCWNWTGSIVPGGYGKFSVEKNTIRKCFNAHRWSYEYFRGPIPDGLTLDHLCRNRKCVNPDHLEPVTIKENILRGVGFSATNARKTHCPQGHPLIRSPFPSHQRRQSRYCPICSSWSERVKK